MTEDKQSQDEKIQKQIHKLATRLPWIVVSIVIIATVLILLQAFFLF